MSHRAITITFKVLVNIIEFTVILFVVVIAIQFSDPNWKSNLASLDNASSFSGSVITGDAIARFWPKEIIIAVTVFLLYLAIFSDWFSKLVAKINMDGNVLIPLLIVLYVVVVVSYILVSNIAYPTPLGDPRLFRVFVLAASSPGVIAFLFSINLNLSRPASDTQFTAHILILFGVAYVALTSWLNYLQSGEFQISYKLHFIS